MRSLCLAISVLLLSLHFSNCLSGNQPTAVTENGVAVGKYSTSQYGKVYRSFQGIPYAKPPVSDNRFKESQRLDDTWIGEWNATAPGSPCLQYDQFTRHRDQNGDYIYEILGDEDCLFLNVYTQEGGPGNKEVIVMIPHGSFQFGTGNGYGPEYIMERDDIVFVTFNYRLGPLGFLTTGDLLVPGNNGLKDQVAVLEWVQRNIAAFGGDPRKVSLFGASGGAASVHYHVLSPLSSGLFNKAYSYSGCALCPWALVKDGPQKAAQLASFLGCPTSDSRTIVECLRKRPARKILEQVKNFHTWMYNPFAVFGPTVEVTSNRTFLDRHPREILRAGKVNDVPWIAGLVSDEGLYPGADFIDNERFLQQLNERWHAIAPSLLFYSDGDKTNITEKITEYYLNNQDISNETVKHIIKMLGDRLFLAPIIEAANLQAQSTSSPVFQYYFRYQGEHSFSQTLTTTNSLFGVCHGDDTAYVIKFSGFDTHNSKDKPMADFMMDILYTYVKTGSPSSSLGWESVPRHPTNNATYLNIVSPQQVEMRSDEELVNLKIIAEIFGDEL